MKIVFNEEVGLLASLLHSLNYSNNINDLTTKLENESIMLSADYRKDLISIRENNKWIVEDLDFFFGRESIIWKSLIHTSRLWEANDSFPNDILELNNLDIKRRLYSKLRRQTKLDLGNDEENIISDNKKFFYFIKSLRIDEREKWNLLCFIEDIDLYKSKFINLINSYLPYYLNLHEKYKPEQNQLIDRLKTLIDKEGISYINNLVHQYVNPEDYSEIHITISVFNNYNLNFAIEGNILYLYMGLRYEKYIKKFANVSSLEESLNVFKNLSEKTRFDIAKFLFEGEHFGQEIAEKLQISTAAVSYQMNYLFAANLVKIRKEDRKVYYVLNRETISKSIDFLKIEFNL